MAWDWWRVEEVEPGARVLLRAETRMPGTARLELRAEPDGPRRSRYVQRVLFTPDGLAGRVYWYAQRPAHDLVFGVMARTVAGVAARRAAPRDRRFGALPPPNRRPRRQRPCGASSYRAKFRVNAAAPLVMARRSTA